MPLPVRRWVGRHGSTRRHKSPNPCRDGSRLLSPGRRWLAREGCKVALFIRSETTIHEETPLLRSVGGSNHLVNDVRVGPVAGAAGRCPTGARGGGGAPRSPHH